MNERETASSVAFIYVCVGTNMSPLLVLSLDIFAIIFGEKHKNYFNSEI